MDTPLTSVTQMFAQASRHYQSGNLDQAEQLCRHLLQADPDYAEAHHLLGLIAQGMGHNEAALACLQQALRLQPGSATFHNELGNVLRALGNYAEAEAHGRHALAVQPDFHEAHNGLGSVLYLQGKHDEAIYHYQQAVRLKPDYAQGYNNFGLALVAQEKLDEAVAYFQKAIQFQPAYANAQSNLGAALLELGRLDEAISCFRQALRLNPNHAEAHCNLGSALSSQGMLPEAVRCYQQAVYLNPNFARAYVGLGDNLLRQGRLEDAIECCRRAVQANPALVEAHNSLGYALAEQGQVGEAIACCQQALALRPDYPPSLSLLVHELQHACQWKNITDLAQRVLRLVESNRAQRPADCVTPFTLLALPITATPKQQLQVAEWWVEKKLKHTVQPSFGAANARRQQVSGKITLGYLSADFRDHPVAYLVAELLEKHDRNRFEIIGYSYGPDDASDIRRRLKKACDRFDDLKSASFAEAARHIQGDGVDILIDLTGFTHGARTEILALRPAPVQVSYLGYLGTMGAPFIDYILVDDFAVPADQQPNFTERLVHVPGCFLASTSRRQTVPVTPSRIECGLGETGFVFCCFSNNFKITPDVFAVWMNLLNAVPGSVLWLSQGNQLAVANLREEARLRGVEPHRLVFAPRLPLAAYLARYRLADLFLDTVPYNAGAVAIDTLWAGCPVLTVAGQTFASRIAGSLLRAVGLPELVTTCLNDYQALALRLAGEESGLLADVRSRLEANRKSSPLFDTVRFARGLESAFAAMWEIHCRGEQPRALALQGKRESA